MANIVFNIVTDIIHYYTAPKDLDYMSLYPMPVLVAAGAGALSTVVSSPQIMGVSTIRLAGVAASFGMWKTNDNSELVSYKSLYVALHQYIVCFLGEMGAKELRKQF